MNKGAGDGPAPGGIETLRPATGTLLAWLQFPGKEGPGPRRWKGVLFRENMGLGRPLQAQDLLLV